MLDVGRKRLPEEKKKTKFVNVPVDEQTLADFAKACELRGTTMAGLLRPHIMEAIHVERERHPEAFKREEPPTAKIIDEPEHFFKQPKRKRA